MYFLFVKEYFVINDSYYFIYNVIENNYMIFLIFDVVGFS